AVWLADDGIVEPLSLVKAIASEAVRLGVTIAEGVRVTALRHDDRRVLGVSTETGNIDADVVVLCGGMWTAQLAAPAGVRIPLHPVEHHYVLSHSIGHSIEGLPVVRDPDGSIYFRGRGEALMLGAFQQTSKPWLVDRIPDDFAFSLREGLARLPLLDTVGIEKFVNGPESFTPDGNPLVGETGELRNLYVN